jgi:DNA-binding XRE family transcriptional regulator
MPDPRSDDIASFDAYLEQQLQDPDFRERFYSADRALDVAIQLATLRRQRQLTQEQVAEMLGTRQQNISRLENPAYRRHSLSMLRRYADVLGGDLVVTVVPRARTQASA